MLLQELFDHCICLFRLSFFKPIFQLKTRLCLCILSQDVNLWKDSLNILKLVVANSSQIQEVAASSTGLTSSQLVQPRGSIGSLLSLAPRLPWGSSLTVGETSFSLTSQMFKKELPGRTLEFSYNVANTPVIGAKFNHLPHDEADCANQGMTAAPCWRKPHNCQVGH